MNVHPCVAFWFLTEFTYVYHIRHIMNIVLGHQGIGACQIEKIVIPGLCAFQFVFRVLGLSLRRKRKTQSHICTWVSIRCPRMQVNQNTDLLFHFLHLLNGAVSLWTFVETVAQ